jgi:hypothetical protein
MTNVPMTGGWGSAGCIYVTIKESGRTDQVARFPGYPAFVAAALTARRATLG